MFRTSICSLTTSILLAYSPISVAQDDDGVHVVPVDTYACTYNEGFGRDDLMEVVGEWNAWMDEKGADGYFAVVVSPQYFGELKMDFGWLGSWETGEKMGAGTDLFIGDGAEVGMKFAKVSSCHTHTNYAATEIKSPAGEMAPDNFVMSFSNCSIEDGKTWDDVFTAADQWAAYQTEQGYSNGTWFMFPGWGEPQDDYDFKVVNTYENHTEMGKAWDLYASGGGWQTYGELMRGVVDCDSSRVYDTEVVRRAIDDE